MKSLSLVVLACALAIGGAHASPVRADDVKTEPAAAKSTIQWVEGWAAGRAAAAKSGKLMLVYVHRVKPG
jgi:hypothetical protein